LRIAVHLAQPNCNDAWRTMTAADVILQQQTDELRTEYASS